MRRIWHVHCPACGIPALIHVINPISLGAAFRRAQTTCDGITTNSHGEPYHTRCYWNWAQ